MYGEEVFNRPMTEEERIAAVEADKAKLAKEIASLKEQLAAATERCAMQRDENIDLQRALERKSLEKETRFLHGMTEGLKYAIRCNGVSGAEVQ